jgi:hypothetical protein
LLEEAVVPFVDDGFVEVVVKVRFWTGAESSSAQTGLFRVRQRCRPDSKHEPEPMAKAKLKTRLG